MLSLSKPREDLLEMFQLTIGRVMFNKKRCANCIFVSSNDMRMAGSVPHDVKLGIKANCTEGYESKWDIYYIICTVQKHVEAPHDCVEEQLK